VYHGFPHTYIKQKVLFQVSDASINNNYVGVMGSIKLYNLSRYNFGITDERTLVRRLVSHVGFVRGQSGAGAGFLQVLRFPLLIFIPPISPKSPSSIIWAGTIGH
jgi:hypothetical protein